MITLLLLLVLLKGVNSLVLGSTLVHFLDMLPVVIVCAPLCYCRIGALASFAARH